MDKKEDPPQLAFGHPSTITGVTSSISEQLKKQNNVENQARGASKIKQ